MDYPKTKVYFDGSHYIGIPHTTQPWKRKKTNDKIKTEQQEKVKEIYKESVGTKKEKIENTINKVNEEIKDIEKATQLVSETLEKEKRNRIVRYTRLIRKIRLQNWTHFCTFTYDSNKLTEEEFRIKFLNCIRHFVNRKNWKYVGVFERSPVNNRLHFHGIFLIPQMIGEIIETKDYSTKTHQMQVAKQNTFFLEKFGRNDFRELDKNSLQDAISYITKYINKTGEKVMCSRHLQTYFITDIIEEDVVCTIGQEDRKILLFDSFNCFDFETGEVLGQLSNDKELINKLPKGY